MVMTIFLSVVTSIVAGLITIELLARASRLSDWLLHRAVNRLPRKHRKRFLEEWAADLCDQPSPVSQLGRALGLQIAAMTITRREKRKVYQARRRTRSYAKHARDAMLAAVMIAQEPYYDTLRAAERRGKTLYWVALVSTAMVILPGIAQVIVRYWKEVLIDFMVTR